ncbi:beta-ketoacyl synthase N-terminal-like domain-containing protein [Streptomyces sp. S1D4-11]
MTAAARLAEADAGPGTCLDPARIGLVLATASGPVTTHNAMAELHAQGLAPSPVLAPNAVAGVHAGHAAVALNARGPTVVLSAGDASGLLALGQAADLVRAGRADVVYVIAADEAAPALRAGFAHHGLLAKETGRPYDVDADGASSPRPPSPWSWSPPSTRTGAGPRSSAGPSGTPEPEPPWDRVASKNRAPPWHAASPTLPAARESLPMTCPTCTAHPGATRRPTRPKPVRSPTSPACRPTSAAPPDTPRQRARCSRHWPPSKPAPTRPSRDAPSPRPGARSRNSPPPPRRANPRPPWSPPSAGVGPARPLPYEPPRYPAPRARARPL